MHEIPAVVFLVYRRPELTRLSLESIRKAAPSRLYVVADGPKDESEAPDCEATRILIDEIVDWPCDVRTNYADKNMGLASRVSSGISWAFETCEEAIILEDDCLASPEFFRFTSELLEFYRDDPRVTAISGNNFQNGIQRGTGSYYFSTYPHCWGWATWKRSWALYKHNCEPMSSEEIRTTDAGHSLSSAGRQFWAERFEMAHDGRVDSWAFRWLQAVWRANGCNALPQRNLVDNQGFGDDATHTSCRPDYMPTTASIPDSQASLIHPSEVLLDHEADQYTEDHVFIRRKPQGASESKAPRRSHFVKKFAQRIWAKFPKS